MRILILADLSRRGLTTDDTNSVRPFATVPVDVDNFEDVLSRIAPTVNVPLSDETAPPVNLVFKELDDFHPDTLYRELDLFQRLRKLRNRLIDPATSAQTAAELGRSGGIAPPTADADSKDPLSEDPLSEDPLSEDDSDTLQRLLGKPSTATRTVTPTPAGNLDNLIRRIVEPHITAGPDPEQQRLLASVDDAAGELMRELLNSGALHSLESTWRGIHWLVSNVETSTELQLFLLDISKESLQQELQRGPADVEGSELYRVLVDDPINSGGGAPWSMLVGHYNFGASADDVVTLATMGVIASQAGAPFLAGADPSVLGCGPITAMPEAKYWQLLDDEHEQLWQALRNHPAARWIGLALPRVLLRLPYGKRSDPVDELEFEEIPEPAKHDSYLWGNPALALALLNARAFLDNGWDMQPGDHLDIGDLPAHTYDDRGEKVLKPCAEILMSERAADAIMSRGIMPIFSYRNMNAIRLARFQSIAEPPTQLGGPWKF